VFAAFKACDNHVGLPSLFNAHAAAHAGQDKAFAVAANQTPILCWQANLRRHSDPAGYVHITLGQLRIFPMGFYG